MTQVSPLQTAIVRWMEQEPEPAYKEALSRLLDHLDGSDSSAVALASEMFSSRLSFGTAGIRGAMRPGPNGMNRTVVSQTTAGLARYLLERNSTTPRTLRVVIGFDGRHHSEVFARDTAEVLSGYGIDALVLPRLLPTPVLAFAVRKLSADAGVMVTASHNPAGDNGYKVYFGGDDEGSQIIPPVDRDIEAHILDVSSHQTWTEIPRSYDRVSAIDNSIVDDYISATLSSLALPPTEVPLSVVYTAMHGVGGETFREAMRQAGFAKPHLVTEQFHPDADFPTVSFPNPEEKGALDLSFDRARQVGADLVIAHDPDADRLAVALPDTTLVSGFRALTGNQVGALFGWYLGNQAQQTRSQGSLANSLVSSPVVGTIARHCGLAHEETLTGFKYVSRVENLLFGFEEALGYLVTPDVVRDKDGISAALLMVSIAHGLAAEGKTLWDLLHDIEDAVGAFASGQVTIRLGPGESGSQVTNSLRKASLTSVGSRAVTRCDDFLEGVLDYPIEDILRYFLNDGTRVIMRPSGTEPKVKVYIDTEGSTSLDAHATLEQVESDIKEIIDAL